MVELEFPRHSSVSPPNTSTDKISLPASKQIFREPARDVGGALGRMRQRRSAAAPGDPGRAPGRAAAPPSNKPAGAPPSPWRSCPRALRQLEVAEPWPVVYSRELRALIGPHPLERGWMKTVFSSISIPNWISLTPPAALYVAHAERIVPRHSRASTVSPRLTASRWSPPSNAHAENDPRVFRLAAGIASRGTWGQHKAQATTGGQRRPQIIVEKQTVDVFLAPNLGRVVEELKRRSLRGLRVVTEICVLYAVRGLLRTGKARDRGGGRGGGLDRRSFRARSRRSPRRRGTLATVSEICRI